MPSASTSTTAQDARTVFVRGLDAAVTDEILSSTFSAIGPVKHAFLVKKRGPPGGINLNHHKGFGFVQFALEEDAVRAVQEMHGTRLEGRVIKVEGAKKRASFEARKEQKLAEKAQQDDDDTEAARGGKGGENGAETEAMASPMSSKGKKKKARVTKTAEQLEKSQLKHNLVKTVAIGGLSAEDVEGAIAFAKSLKVSTGKSSKGGKQGAKAKKKRNQKKKGVKGGRAEDDEEDEEADETRLLEVSDVVYPVSAEIHRQYRFQQDGCSGEVVMIRYASVKDALLAVRLLHGQQKTFRQSGMKKKSGRGARTVVLWARQVSGDGLYLKKHRVVVRNLPFDATEEDVRDAFGDFMLWEVTLPVGADGNARGFAFVGFVCRQDAERAISKVNGTEIRGRTVAVDWAMSKREFEDEKQRKDDAETGKGEKGEKGEKDEKRRRQEVTEGGVRPGQELESGSDEEIDMDVEKSRVNNVLDSILGGDEDYFEEIEESDDDSSEGAVKNKGDDSIGDASSDSQSGGSGTLTESSDSDASGSAESESHDGSDASESSDMLERDTADVDTKKAVVEKLNEQAKRLEASLSKTSTKEPYTVEPGATVFIRNIPIDATQKTVFEAMKKFGFVKSTRLVLNKQTQRPKGTAFVDFRSAEDASRAAEASQKAADKSGPPVIIAGKPVEIHIALGTDDIRDLAVQKSKGMAPDTRGEKGRNLYLAQEGLIAEGSAAWNSLSNSDKEKRARAANESAMKLKSPNFAVSKTRLNIRNVPKNWDERKLKDLFIKAVKSRATKESPKIVQVKILTNPSGASKGIAFIEFKQHDHALCALRELNNNPDTWSKDHRPIVEFAIDNVQALKKRTMNQLKQIDSRTNKDGKDGKDGNPDKTDADKKKKKKKKDAEDTETKSKRKLRMERRQMLKQKNRNANNKPPGKATNTESEAPAAKLGKAARRRAQRRKQVQDMAIDGLAKTGVNPGGDTSKKKRKTDNSVEAQVEARLAKQTLAGKRQRTSSSLPQTRWFE